MFNGYKGNTFECRGRSFLLTLGWLLCWILALGSVSVTAQDQQNQTPANPAQTPSQTPDTGKPKQDVPAEAGGPSDTMGPYAIPKKKAEEPPPPPKPVTPKKIEASPTTP